MAKEIVHVMFDIPAEQLRQLTLLKIERGCSLKAMLQKAVAEYLQRVSETEQELEER